jgi:hypothetical protein
MPNYFCKIFYRYQDVGVSEVYATTQANIGAATTIADQIVAHRQAMLCTDVTILATVTSDSDIRGDAELGEGYPKVGTYTGDGAKTYDPTITNLTRWTDAALVKRAMRHIRLIPDDQFGTDSTFSPIVGWTTPRSTFFAFAALNLFIPTKIKGAVAPPFYTFTPVFAATSERKSHKKVGRPFGLSVGRRVIR